jgi:hypothetical protein
MHKKIHRVFPVIFWWNLDVLSTFLAYFCLGLVASLNRFLDFLLESSSFPVKIAKRIESSGIDSGNRPSTTPHMNTLILLNRLTGEIYPRNNFAVRRVSFLSKHFVTAVHAPLNRIHDGSSENPNHDKQGFGTPLQMITLSFNLTSH